MKEIKTENDVKALVKAWFEARGGWSYAPIQNGLGESGIHDRIGCVPITITQDMVGYKIGVFVSIEAKRPGRRTEPRRGMTARQNIVMDEIYGARGRTIVCDGPGDLLRLEDTRWWLRT